MATSSISGDTKLIYKHLIYHECIIHMIVISGYILRDYYQKQTGFLFRKYLNIGSNVTVTCRPAI